MLICVFQQTSEVMQGTILERIKCINCGFSYPPIDKETGRLQWELNPDPAMLPQRFCPNSPDLRPAADRLDYPQELAIVPGLAPLLSAWMAAGYPERERWQDFVFRVPCESRRPSGTCNAFGCPNGTVGKNIMCHWLYRMATASCPEKKFTCNPRKN